MKKKRIHQRLWNRFLGQLARVVPGATSLRPFLHRRRGVRIEGTVFIGDDVYLENEYPECIELREGAQICLKSILIAHTRGAGRIIVGRNVFLGSGSIVTASPGRTLRIGDGAVVVAGTLISSDVPPGVLFGNEKGKALARATVPLALGTPYPQFLAGLRPLEGPRTTRPD